jgi:alpha-galactosidase
MDAESGCGLVSRLQDVGYIYVNIDDCWSLKERNSSGYIVADPQKFPKGIDGLSKEAQGLGLRLGIYSDAGTKTCAGYPGSLGHEMEDAKLWASWEIDCRTPNPYVQITNLDRSQI